MAESKLTPHPVYWQTSELAGWLTKQFFFVFYFHSCVVAKDM
jgi:hypothetical protein